MVIMMYNIDLRIESLMKCAFLVFPRYQFSKGRMSQIGYNELFYALFLALHCFLSLSYPLLCSQSPRPSTSIFALSLFP